MIALIQFYAFIFTACFAWQLGKPELSIQQKLRGALKTSLDGLLVFSRASISMLLFAGPLVLATWILFPRLIGFDGVSAFLISVLLIGLLDRLVSIVLMPVIRSFWYKKNRLMPQALESIFYTLSIAILLSINLSSVPGIEISTAVLYLFFGFSLYFSHHLFALVRLRQLKRRTS